MITFNWLVPVTFRRPAQYPSVTGLCGRLLTVFVECVPFETALRIWDLLLHDGAKARRLAILLTAQIPFRIALAALRINEDQLLKVSCLLRLASFFRCIYSSPATISTPYCCSLFRSTTMFRYSVHSRLAARPCPLTQSQRLYLPYFRLFAHTQTLSRKLYDADLLCKVRLKLPLLWRILKLSNDTSQLSLQEAMVISTYGIMGFSLQEVTELRAKYLSQVPLRTARPNRCRCKRNWRRWMQLGVSSKLK